MKSSHITWNFEAVTLPRNSGRNAAYLAYRRKIHPAARDLTVTTFPPFMLLFIQ